VSLKLCVPASSHAAVKNLLSLRCRGEPANQSKSVGDSRLVHHRVRAGALGLAYVAECRSASNREIRGSAAREQQQRGDSGLFHPSHMCCRMRPVNPARKEV